MAGDVVELILSDHRKFEGLLRDIRDVGADRIATLGELADLLVAHAEAEEREVYPSLRWKDAIDVEEVEHSKHEHAEGHQALLRVLEIGDPEAEGFGDAIEDLTKELAHHMDEEERTVLNPAKEEVAEEKRQDLGVAFMRERQRLLEQGCGSVENVRRLLERATEEGEI